MASTMKNLRQFLIAQELIKDIPYLMIQGCNPLVDPLYLHPESDEVNWTIVSEIRKEAIKQIIKSPLSDRINEDNFIGWPIFSRIGGYYADNILDKLDPDRIKLRVSENDSHPNGEGHKIISDHIYNIYEKVYR